MRQIRMPHTINAPFLSVLILLMIFSSTIAWADDPQSLAITLESFKVQSDPSGQDTLTSAETSRPGDILVYVATYQNRIDRPLGNVKGVIPIPADMEYLPGSADPKQIEASTDGVEFAPAPLKRKVQLASGKIEERSVPYRDYRALRWDLGTLTPGQKIKVQARARIISK